MKMNMKIESKLKILTMVVLLCNLALVVIIRELQERVNKIYEGQQFRYNEPEIIMAKGKEILISYERINQNKKFNDLGSSVVYDNASGNASCTTNKSSVYLFSEDECLARMVNISYANIDGLEDFSLWGKILIEMVTKQSVVGIKHHLRMNKDIYAQLVNWWYAQKECEEPEEVKSFAGAEIVIDNRILNNQETVL